MIDPKNCGACGVTCGANMACGGGACACTPGFADCNHDPSDGCEADLSNDDQNCGTCGRGCFIFCGVGCAGGVCPIAGGGCIAGFGDCDGNAANGCETRLSNDPNNCGCCGIVCASGTTCVAGVCM